MKNWLLVNHTKNNQPSHSRVSAHGSFLYYFREQSKKSLPIYPNKDVSV